MPIIIILAAYLLGSISTAILICRLMKLPDPRAEGSGNPGATNVLRIGGKFPAALTLMGDFAKGLIPVLAAKALNLSDTVLALAGAAAFIGHLYPIFFRFQGGKGVATALGALAGLSPTTTLVTALTWLAINRATSISSIAAIGAFILAPIYLWLFTHNSAWCAVIAAVCAWSIWRHRSNIQRLWRGEEHAFRRPK